jgi:hypothetical protein
VKKLVVLIIIVVILIGLFKVLGIDTSIFSKSKKNKDATWQSSYEVMTENNSYEDIIGAPLPQSADDIHAQVYFYSDRGHKCSWIVAKLGKEEFHYLTEQLHSVNQSNLIDIWPEAFSCQIEEFNRFWDLSNIVDEFTFYREEPLEATRRMFKYENGKLYVKKVTRYITSSDENGKLIHKRE